MKFDKTRARISQQRAFGPTLEWESLPVLGARESRLAVVARGTLYWGIALGFCALFWGGVIWSIWG